MSDDLDGPKATNPMGEAQNEVLHLDFDRRVMVQFRGTVVLSHNTRTNEQFARDSENRRSSPQRRGMLVELRGVNDHQKAG
jgi:hypothetical protein